jgi:hypothetical protein
MPRTAPGARDPGDFRIKVVHGAARASAPRCVPANGQPTERDASKRLGAPQAVKREERGCSKSAGVPARRLISRSELLEPYGTGASEGPARRPLFLLDCPSRDADYTRIESTRSRSYVNRHVRVAGERSGRLPAFGVATCPVSVLRNPVTATATTNSGASVRDALNTSPQTPPPPSTPSQSACPPMASCDTC